MGTRALIQFKDKQHSFFNVYQHWDGYPSGIKVALVRTLESGLAWPLPRFEADEFAAAFIAANKDAPGNYRLVECPLSVEVQEYYRVTYDGDTLKVSHNDSEPQPLETFGENNE